MTKLKPNSVYGYVMIEGTKEIRHWVRNREFSVHLNDKVLITDGKSIAFVRVIRRTKLKPIKGDPIWRVIATDNQFPVAENIQVVACHHVAPAPMSIALIKEDLIEARNSVGMAEIRANKAKDKINKIIEGLN